jgi:hypothetical protein
LSPDEVDQLRGIVDRSEVDLERVRLLYHRASRFAKGSSEDAITRCKWVADPEPRV